MQMQMIKDGYMSLDDLTDEEIDRLGDFIDLEDLPHD